jgi:hypothetical protein
MIMRDKTIKNYEYLLIRFYELIIIVFFNLNNIQTNHLSIVWFTLS